MSDLTEVIQKMIERRTLLLYTKKQLPKASFVRQGPITLAILKVPKIKELFIGISKRNPADKNDPIKGDMLALQRAVDSFVNDDDGVTL